MDSGSWSFYVRITQFAVHQLAITRGFPARLAIREIGADYAFQIEKSRPVIALRLHFETTFRRRNELWSHVEFASETSQPFTQCELSLPLGGRLHNITFDFIVQFISFSCLVNYFSIARNSGTGKAIDFRATPCIRTYELHWICK